MVRTKAEKMRFRTDFWTRGGYRDIQLVVKFRGLKHLCELQVHLVDIEEERQKVLAEAPNGLEGGGGILGKTEGDAAASIDFWLLARARGVHHERERVQHVLAHFGPLGERLGEVFTGGLPPQVSSRAVP